MKKLLFVIFLSFASNIGYSQDYGNKASALELCANMGSSNFETDISAENALELILNTIGASKRFVLLPCENVNNASAFSLKGIRYIFYNKDFMQSIDSGNNWGNLFVLAHEVGHHINNHTLDFVLYATKTIGTITLKQKRQQEIEADEFAGFVLAKLGGSLSEANKLIQSISSNKDDTYSTHPSRNKRLKAVKIGFHKAKNQFKNKQLEEKIIYYENGAVKAKAYFVDGKLQGEQFQYFKNGEVKAKANYIDGQQQFELIEYYENGAVKAKANYVDDKLQGEAIIYSVNGEIERIENYKDGVLINNKN